MTGRLICQQNYKKYADYISSAVLKVSLSAGKQLNLEGNYTFTIAMDDRSIDHLLSQSSFRNNSNRAGPGVINVYLA